MKWKVSGVGGQPFAFSPDISVIIPVWKEAKVITKTLTHLRSIDGGLSLEIIVVDGHPAASTLAVIPEKFKVRAYQSTKGRARQMNRGADLASGDIVLFLHADTRVPGNAVSLIRRSLTDRAIVAGAFKLGIDSPRWSLRFIAWVANQRTRYTRIPYGDQAIFVRSNYFQRIGGYPELPLMEDVELMRRIKRNGDQITLLDSPVSTSSRRWDKEGPVFTTLRNWTLVTMYLLGVPPGKLIRWYQ